MPKKIHLLLFFMGIFSMVSLFRCANVFAPTGGEKDSIPPTLVQTVPPQQSVNASPDEIRLYFDEYVELKNITEELLITPTIPETYKLSYIKDYVYLKLEEPLADSTTYTFNFRNGIVDITEANIAENAQLVFSTGDFLDSMAVSGTVKTLLTNEIPANVSVALYRTTDTLDVFKDKPLYLTQSTLEGTYQLENIKNGIYTLFAFIDENKNLTIESQLEPYAFFPDPVILDSAVAGIKLELQTLDVRDLRIQSSRPSGHYYEIKLNKPFRFFEIHPLDTNQNVFYQSIDGQKGIRFYNTLSENQDSLGISTTFIDSLSNSLEDTLYVKFEETRRSKESFQFRFEKEPSDYFNDTLRAEITFTKPIIDVQWDSLYIMQDTVKLLTIPDTVAHHLDSLAMHLWLTLPVETIELSPDTSSQIATTSSVRRPGESVRQKAKAPPAIELVAAAHAFISVEKDSSDHKTEKYAPFLPDDYGQINGTVTTDAPSYFLQLLNEDDQVVRELRNPTSFEFKHLEPGKYYIRALVDENENGRWDPGNPKNRVLPEPVYFYEEDPAACGSDPMNNLTRDQESANLPTGTRAVKKTKPDKNICKILTVRASWILEEKNLTFLTTGE